MKNGLLKALTDAVEENLYQSWDVRAFAGEHYISVAQLYRDFTAATGHTVKEYTRRRRLSNALALLRSTDFSVARIAEQCGYASVPAFYKTARQLAGVTPVQYRQGRGFFYAPPVSGRNSLPISVTTQAIPAMARFLYRGLPYKGVEEHAVRSFFGRYPGFSGRLLGRSGRSGWYELLAERAALPEKGEPGHAILEKKEDLPSFTATFAMVPAPNEATAIAAAWNFLYHDWLETSAFAHAPAPYFEEYLYKGTEPYRLHLYVPVEKRRSAGWSVALEYRMEQSYLLLPGSSPEAFGFGMVKEALLLPEGKDSCWGIPLMAECKGQGPVYRAPSGEYAVLTCKSSVDPSPYRGILQAWIKDHCLEAQNRPIFTLYPVGRGTGPTGQDRFMQLCCLLKT